MDRSKVAAETIVSMSLDYIQGGITKGTYITNLEMYSKILREEYEEEKKKD